MTLSVDLELRRGTLDLRVSFSLEDGEVLAVLGPNGAGKSTLLRAIAGLEPIDSGAVSIGSKVMEDRAGGVVVPPEQRPVAMVFQDYLLFPHLSVVDNIAFGPRARGMAKVAARAEASAWLDAAGLSGYADAKPSELSGGQAQRVALGRAMAARPEVLLLDEPLSALDATVRGTVRRDLHRHLASFGGATVLVSHDPLDALALADRVVILEAGAVTQTGTIAEVTTRPKTAYVADLIGVNLLHGVAEGNHVALTGHAGRVTIASAVTGPVSLLIHPHSITLHRDRPDSSARNQWHGQVVGFDLMGDRVRVRMVGDLALIAEVTPAAVADLGLVEGGQVWATAKATDISCYPA